MISKARALDERSHLAIAGVLQGKSRPKAMVDAGYSKHYADRAATKFFERPEVRAAIAKGHAEIREASMYDVLKAMAHAEEVRAKALIAGNYMAACKAVELLSKLAGLLDQTLRIEHVNVAVALADAHARRTIPWNNYAEEPRALSSPTPPSRMVDPFED